MEYYNEYNDGMLMSFAGLIWIGIICIYGLCIYGTYKYAKRLGRSGSWGVLAVLMSPFLASFVLCLMGETDAHRKARIIEEEMWRSGKEADAVAGQSAEDNPTDASGNADVGSVQQ